jgi:phage/plasmid-like protein (TIGR03299 family)
MFVTYGEVLVMAHQLVAGKDSMFSVKKRPWHGLGTVVESAPTVAEAIRLASLDWDVLKEQLRCPDGTAVDAYAIRRRDTGDVVGDSVGARFTPLQNREAFAWFEPFVQTGVASLETAGSLFAGRRVWVLAKLKAKNAEITTGDQVEKFLLLAHAHDGSLAVRCGLTPIRVVCNNTLSSAIGQGERSGLAKIRHTKSIGDGLAAAQEMIREIDTQFERVADVFRALAKNSITGKEFSAYVRQTLELGKDKPNEELSTKARNILSQVVGNMEENRSIARELYDRWEAGRAEEQRSHQQIGAALLDELTGNLEVGRGAVETQGAKGPTWWHAYNAVTEHLSHQRGRTPESRLDQSWFGAGASINRQALQNAMIGAAV